VTTVFNLAYACLFLGMAVVVWRATRPRPARRVAEHDVGPDALRLLEDLEDHMTAYEASVRSLYDRPRTPHDPVIAAGCDRLRQAIRDHEKGGLS